MKDEPRQVIRVIKAFKTENAVYELDEVYSVRVSLAKRFASEGLVEFVTFDDEEEEAEDVDTPTGPAWTEAELGTFHFDNFGWTKRVEMPAFEAFRFGSRRKRESAKTYQLLIDAESAEESPAPAALALAKRVLGNQEALAAKVAEALWADFTGSGPDSGMWWHGDLNQVADGMEEGQPPRGAGDLFKLLRLSEIRITKSSSGSECLRAELNFEAAFEEEHGVGILTDGAEILGIGYSGDASEFAPRE
jgi:hypothetical protein